MGESTREAIRWVANVEQAVSEATQTLSEVVSEFGCTIVELTKRNEMLAEKLEDSNDRYASMLGLPGADPGMEGRHLLRDLKWALQEIISVFPVDSYNAARARIIAGRFSLPLATSMADKLTQVEDFMGWDDEEVSKFAESLLADELLDFTVSAEEDDPPLTEDELEELADVVAAELREDEEFHQSFKAAMEAALDRLSPKDRRDWERSTKRADWPYQDLE